MDLYKEYLSGHIVDVSEEIKKLGRLAFVGENFSVREDIDLVLKEMLSRVNRNIEKIYQALKKVDYNLSCDALSVVSIANEEKESKLQKLRELVSPLGYLPLSLEYFYRIVGSVNFTHNFNASEFIIPEWQLADPLQIYSLDEQLLEMESYNWYEEMDIICKDNNEVPPYLFLSPDSLHKDNISGSIGYAIEITKERTVDSRVLFEPHQTFFIDYLRVCFDSYGFPGLIRGNENKLNSFYEIVEGKLEVF